MSENNEDTVNTLIEVNFAVLQATFHFHLANLSLLRFYISYEMKTDCLWRMYATFINPSKGKLKVIELRSW